MPVSIKMAKLQGLPLSPMEISGTCGRLLCCLTYENAYYLEVQDKMPRTGDIVSTADGEGRVTGHNAVKETVQVELESGIRMDVPLSGIQSTRQPDVATASRRPSGESGNTRPQGQGAPIAPKSVPSGKENLPHDEPR
jgi:cell fate regulator YaaT (PSP1 superfamily)